MGKNINGTDWFFPVPFLKSLHMSPPQRYTVLIAFSIEICHSGFLFIHVLKFCG